MAGHFTEADFMSGVSIPSLVQPPSEAKVGLPAERGRPTWCDDLHNFLSEVSGKIVLLIMILLLASYVLSRFGF